MPPKEKNVVIRSENPGVGNGRHKATSQRTGWEYEHDETDEQIDAIEDLIETIRAEEGVTPDSPQTTRGVTFTWNSKGPGKADVVIGTAGVVPGDGVVNARGQILEGAVWQSETWTIKPDGTVEGPVVS